MKGGVGGAVLAVIALILAAAPASATGAPTVQIAPGITYRTFDTPAAHGTAHVHLLDVDLGEPRTSVDLLHPPAVAERRTVSTMADAQGAAAGVNGDFFNISEPATHPGVQPTGSSDGPEVAAGRERKAAVPDGQRFGPALPPGTTAEDVIGVGSDRRAHLGRLSLQGSVRSQHGTTPIRGLNQFALPVDGVGAYTAAWGPASLVRPTCGTDTDRNAPCSADTHRVTVRHGVVTAVADAPGSDPVPEDTTVLLGREEGADALRPLQPGDPVTVAYHLASAAPSPFAFAVGGFPILRGGAPLPGLETAAAAIRTSAGMADGGRRMLLLALDGTGAGLTVAEEATLMHGLGATDAVNLDGGGSTTLVVRLPGHSHVTVENHPTDGAERRVANGVGVFAPPR
jgi:hypothetical protein